MGSPGQYLLRMTVFIAVVLLGLFVIGGQLFVAFSANPILNGIIVGVMIIGIVYSIWLVLRLWPEVSWVRRYRDGEEVSAAPPLMSSMASMLGERRKGLWLTAGTMRSMLDGLGSRLDEGREISRYLIGLLVFLGLLGTFWGLLETIEGVTGAIGSLSVGAGENFASVFGRFKTDLLNSLGGAGTAFSTSLFGLGGSLIVGFLDLQASQSQNRFYMDLEDWLSRETRLSSLPVDVEDLQEGNAAEFMGKALDFMARQLATISTALRRDQGASEESLKSLRAVDSHVVELNATLTRNLTDLADRIDNKLESLAEQLRAERNQIASASETQAELKAIVTRLAETRDDSSEMQQELRDVLARLAASREVVNDQDAIADSLRAEFRTLANRLTELQYESRPVLQQVVEDNRADRRQLIDTLRNEFRILARTLATLTSPQRGGPRNQTSESVEG